MKNRFKQKFYLTFFQSHLLETLSPTHRIWTETKKTSSSKYAKKTTAQSIIRGTVICMNKCRPRAPPITRDLTHYITSSLT